MSFQPFGTGAVEALREACPSSKLIEYSPKTVLFAQGALTDTVFFIASGLVKLTHVDPAGKEIIVGIRRPGWMLGVAAALLSQPQATGAITVTPCRLLRSPVTEVQGSIGAESSFSKYIHQFQAQEIHDHRHNLIELASHSAEDRLATLLADLTLATKGFESNSSAHERVLCVPLKQWEIAQLLGVTPEYLCRVIRRLERRGFLLRRGKLLFVVDPGRTSR
jgi:CRP-like cAMP-binding protein